MIIIGEKLNSSIKETRLAMEKTDTAYIAGLANKQIQAGANYLDLNAAMFMEEETKKLIWALQTILTIANGKIMLDSTNFGAIGKVLEEVAIPDAILNSITLEKTRFSGFLPLIIKYNTGVVALPINEKGVPATAMERAQVAKQLVQNLVDEGVAKHKIFVDALVETAATGDGPKRALDTIRRIREEDAKVHIVCGLSNVSFGLPNREALNMAFLSAAIHNGLDSVIMDITNDNLSRILHAAEVIAGMDEYCLNYIEFSKKKDN